MLKTNDYKDKEKRYNDKIKALKSDNRNLKKLYEDQEKLHNEKIHD
jgi:nitrate/nitrite-specific signal transduction histidine kinase